MKLGFAVLLGIVLGSFPATVHAQRPGTFASPGQFLQIIETGKGQRRTYLDKELQMRFLANQTCQVKTWRGYIERGESGVFMRLYCDMGDMLVVLGRTKNGRWRYEGSVRLWNMNGKVQVEPIVEPPVDDIVVRDNEVENGTSIWQDDFMMFKVIHNRLRKVLDTVEHSYLRQWTEPFHWVRQKSTFVILPATKKQPAEVDETAKITSSSGDVVLERAFQWSQEADTFDVGMWDSAQVTPKPPPTH